MPDGGGRVTELTARPLLNLFYPDLAGIRQPLAGEIAARRELLERLPFATGYGVDIGLLIDAYSLAGLDAIAQVDLEVRQNAHQPLRDLGPMAYAVLQAVAVRLEREARLRGPLPATLRALRARMWRWPSRSSRSSVRRCVACARRPETARPRSAFSRERGARRLHAARRALEVPVGAPIAQLLGRLAQRAQRGEGEGAPDRHARHPERGQLGACSACRPRASTLTGRSTDSTTCRMSCAVLSPGANSTSAPAS